MRVSVSVCNPLHTQVNALVLTIPFAIIPDLHFEYWTELQDYLDLCDSDLVRSFHEVRDIYRSSTLGESLPMCVSKSDKGESALTLCLSIRLLYPDDVVGVNDSRDLHIYWLHYCGLRVLHIPT